ncbi:MAG: hypothetical protein Q4B70_18630, partial [Lachnospiraceae bacterium]|nr:hypothetical protein [Lachnospiraceae bacterium]
LTVNKQKKITSISFIKGTAETEYVYKINSTDLSYRNLQVEAVYEDGTKQTISYGEADGNSALWQLYDGSCQY